MADNEIKTFFQIPLKFQSDFFYIDVFAFRSQRTEKQFLKFDPCARSELYDLKVVAK